MRTNFFAWKVHAKAEYDADRFCFLIAAVHLTLKLPWVKLYRIARLAWMWVLFCHPTLVQRFINFIVPFKPYQMKTTPSPSSLNPGIAESLQFNGGERSMISCTCFGVWIRPNAFMWISILVTACKWIKSLLVQCKLVVNPLGGKNTWIWLRTPWGLQANCKRKPCLLQRWPAVTKHPFL